MCGVAPQGIQIIKAVGNYPPEQVFSLGDICPAPPAKNTTVPPADTAPASSPATSTGGSTSVGAIVGAVSAVPETHNSIISGTTSTSFKDSLKWHDYIQCMGHLVMLRMYFLHAESGTGTRLLCPASGNCCTCVSSALLIYTSALPTCPYIGVQERF